MNKQAKITNNTQRNLYLLRKNKLGRDSPDTIRIPKKAEPFKHNRCCLAHPKQKDFGQITEQEKVDPINDSSEPVTSERYSTLLNEQFGFDPAQAFEFLREKQLKNVLCGNDDIAEKSAQHDNHILSKYVETADGTLWRNIDGISDVEKLLKEISRVHSPINQCNRICNNISISDVPKVKMIAVKFLKYKQNNIELRRVEEKLVCVEYDVYDEDSKYTVQKMRAFFCVKPVHIDTDLTLQTLPEIPASIKQHFDVNESFEKCTNKEIEIIDEKIQENKSYLDDLKRIFKRKQMVIDQKKKKMDLKTLYEIAKKESNLLFGDVSNANLLSKADLEDVKELILQNCKSSIHGINRRKLLSRHGSRSSAWAELICDTKM